MLLLPWLLPLLKDIGGNLLLLGEVGRGKPVGFHEEFPHEPLDDPEAEAEDEHSRLEYRCWAMAMAEAVSSMESLLEMRNCRSESSFVRVLAFTTSEAASSRSSEEEWQGLDESELEANEALEEEDEKDRVPFSFLLIRFSTASSRLLKLIMRCFFSVFGLALGDRGFRVGGWGSW